MKIRNYLFFGCGSSRFPLITDRSAGNSTHTNILTYEQEDDYDDDDGGLHSSLVFCKLFEFTARCFYGNDFLPRFINHIHTPLKFANNEYLSVCLALCSIVCLRSTFCGCT